MSYTVLARRYRSRSFDEVVGQEEIARTLQRAVEQGKTAHAYLFVGTRGVGKTSTARVLAKALNCPNDEPPEVAQAIMQGRDTDVVEIDAASNRGVDEARSLIANASIRPLRGRYKIYIIDEVHMLTREAANALLKTMEEPPEHVKFILCTTEAHKVPATIQSRCQRFDFRAIPAKRIAAHLQHVLEQEGVEAEEEVVLRVAEMGAGSMRDALSLLDRLLASREEGQRLTMRRLRDLLGLPPDELVADLLAACLDGDQARALQLGRELLAQGLDVEQALHAVAQEVRDVMALALAPDDEELTPRAGERRSRALQLAERLEPSLASHMIALCDAVALRARNSAIAAALFDVAMVRLASTGRLATAAALLQGEDAARGSPRKKG
ncbi:MAG: DNA polymerase III subunit gamma/tau [Planctomycetota bacterium]|nr:MAG: DNA polymerase III subunit gamma/tau [Planctomycetota bacterium]